MMQQKKVLARGGASNQVQRIIRQKFCLLVLLKLLSYGKYCMYDW
jgi:hypothetical protein